MDTHNKLRSSFDPSSSAVNTKLLLRVRRPRFPQNGQRVHDDDKATAPQPCQSDPLAGRDTLRIRTRKRPPPPSSRSEKEANLSIADLSIGENTKRRRREDGDGDVNLNGDCSAVWIARRIGTVEKEGDVLMTPTRNEKMREGETLRIVDMAVEPPSTKKKRDNGNKRSSETTIETSDHPSSKSVRLRVLPPPSATSKTKSLPQSSASASAPSPPSKVVPVRHPLVPHYHASLSESFRLRSLRPVLSLLNTTHHPPLNSETLPSILNSSCVPHGTAMHLAAVLDDGPGMRILLEMGGNAGSCCDDSNKALENRMAPRDGDGLTAYEVAKFMDSHNVLGVLKEHVAEREVGIAPSCDKIKGADRMTSAAGDEDRNEYVYDIYTVQRHEDILSPSVEKDKEMTATTTPAPLLSEWLESMAPLHSATHMDDASSNSSIVSLINGVGYWDENNGPVLEYYDWEKETYVAEYSSDENEEGEEDENNERYIANDYPDEDSTSEDESEDEEMWHRRMVRDMEAELNQGVLSDNDEDDEDYVGPMQGSGWKGSGGGEEGYDRFAHEFDGSDEDEIATDYY